MASFTTGWDGWTEDSSSVEAAPIEGCGCLVESMVEVAFSELMSVYAETVSARSGQSGVS